MSRNISRFTEFPEKISEIAGIFWALLMVGYYHRPPFIKEEVKAQRETLAQFAQKHVDNNNQSQYLTPNSLLLEPMFLPDIY